MNATSKVSCEEPYQVIHLRKGDQKQKYTFIIKILVVCIIFIVFTILFQPFLITIIDFRSSEVEFDLHSFLDVYWLFLKSDLNKFWIYIIYTLVGLVFGYILVRVYRFIGDIFPYFLLGMILRFKILMRNTRLRRLFMEEHIWYVECNTIRSVDFKRPNGYFREIVINRWKEVFLLPIALNLTIATSTMNNFGLDPTILGLSELLLALIVPISLALILPTIWQYEDVGINRVKLGEKDQITYIQNAGSMIREKLDILVGFGIIIQFPSILLNYFRGSIRPSELTDFLSRFLYLSYFLLIGLCWSFVTLIPCLSIISIGYFENSHSPLTEKLTKKIKMNLPLVHIKHDLK
ncbi:MAG: hypothetical protein ACFFAU_10915 [Candidatus Hodarchaeota archaeon]